MNLWKLTFWEGHGLAELDFLEGHSVAAFVLGTEVYSGEDERGKFRAQDEILYPLVRRTGSGWWVCLLYAWHA